MAVPAKASIASGRREEGGSSREISTSIGPSMIPPISMAGNYSPEPTGGKQWICEQLFCERPLLSEERRELHAYLSADSVFDSRVRKCRRQIWNYESLSTTF